MEAAIAARFSQKLSRLSSEQYEVIDRKVGGGDCSEPTAFPVAVPHEIVQHMQLRPPN